MIYLINSSFIAEFSATAILFILCFLSVLGVKSLYYAIKDFFPTRKRIAKEKTAQHEKHVKLPKKKQIKPIRSIEINPDEVDRIYVKKIS